jgi:glycosyltransferase involved in cell wall biosynthesis
MKIAFVYDGLYPYLKGGAERRYFELATRLSDRHDVHYITWNHWGAARSAPHEGFTVHGVGVPRPFYGNDGKRTVGEAAAFAARLVPALLRERYDVIDCSATPYLPLYSCALAARRTRTPLVATWHEFWGDHWRAYLPERPAVARIAQHLEAGCRRLGDIRVAVSPFTARRLAEGPGGVTARVVGNGVSLDAIKRMAPSDEASDIVFVGRLIEDKKVDLLLQALHRLIGEFPGLRCTVVGDGPEREHLEHMTASLSLGANVRFTGHVEDGQTVALMKAARVFALPSIREGFGITVLEAQASGCVPVVARGPHTAAPDLVRHDVDGLVCDPTPESLAASLGSLLRDPVRLAAMKAQAERSVAASDWDRVTGEMEDIYGEAVAAANGRRVHAPRVSADPVKTSAK